MDYQLKEIDTVAKCILDNVTSKVLLLYGDMGAGKTTLIKSLVKALGGQDDVSSPTFSIVNEYNVLDGLVYHFDLYRLKDIEEAYNFGIEEYLYSNQWIIMEWPQLIESLLPEESNRIDLVINNHLSRSITLNHNTNFNELKSKVIQENNR